MDEECYVVQVLFDGKWVDLMKYRYIDEESEARALSLAENVLHQSRTSLTKYDHRIIQTKVVIFVPRKD